MIGPELRALRQEHGLTQAELAKLLGCQQKQISWWEIRSKSINKMKEIAIKAVLDRHQIPRNAKKKGFEKIAGFKGSSLRKIKVINKALRLGNISIAQHAVVMKALLAVEKSEEQKAVLSLMES
jgi:transcriptional regulator with XRE-family HTH domain